MQEISDPEYCILRYRYYIQHLYPKKLDPKGALVKLNRMCNSLIIFLIIRAIINKPE
jgi:hypothetical protein